MKVKIFRDESYTYLEYEVNEWLSNKKLKVFNVLQSESYYAYDDRENTYVTISIFYEDSE